MLRIWSAYEVKGEVIRLKDEAQVSIPTPAPIQCVESLDPTYKAGAAYSTASDTKYILGVRTDALRKPRESE